MCVLRLGVCFSLCVAVRHGVSACLFVCSCGADVFACTCACMCVRVQCRTGTAKMPSLFVEVHPPYWPAEKFDVYNYNVLRVLAEYDFCYAKLARDEGGALVPIDIKWIASSSDPTLCGPTDFCMFLCTSQPLPSDAL